MNINRNITIEAPASLVFRHLIDPKLLQTWITSMKDYQCVSTPADGAIAGRKFSYNAGGNVFEQTIEEILLDQKYVAFYECSGYLYKDEFLLNESDGMTRLTGECSVTFKTLKWKLTGLFLGWAIRIDMSNNMKLLKKAVENYSEQDVYPNA